MRILLLNDFRIGGGAEIIFLKTFEILKELGCDVDIIYRSEKILAPTSVFSYIFSIGEYRKMYKRLKEKKYDIVYLLNYAYAYSPSILWAIKKYKKNNPQMKVIYNAHDAHLICPNSGLMFFKKNAMYLFPLPLKEKDFLIRKLDRRGHVFSILKKMQWLLAYKILNLHTVFDNILCPSLFLMANIKKVYPEKEIHLLRNPLKFNSSLIKRRKKGCELLKFVYFGRLSSEKGIDVLITKMSELPDAFEFHIYGEGPEKIQLEELIINLNMEQKIILKGKLPWIELMDRLSLYHAFILPSSCYENAPLSIVEAAASGLYILTMGYGGMNELAQMVGNYCFINPISSMSLHQAFDFIRNEEFRESDLSPFSEETFKITLANSLKL